VRGFPGARATRDAQEIDASGDDQFGSGGFNPSSSGRGAGAGRAGAIVRLRRRWTDIRLDKAEACSPGLYMGRLLMLVSGPLRPIIGNSEAWHSIARLLTR
jgi:hypothetical protein